MGSERTDTQVIKPKLKIQAEIDRQMVKYIL